jgi:single-stranded-DNA-specific exonuclease
LKAGQVHWKILPEVCVPAALQRMVGGHPLLAETLVRRGITHPEAARAFLDPDCYSPAAAEELPDLVPLVDHLENAINRGDPIWVWGDFDVDGQTATTLLVAALRDVGAQVMHYIPVRARESHGVNLPGLKSIVQSGGKVVLTCDTGITAHDAVEYARQAGIDFLITDHHDLPPELPAAPAVVNPKRLPENHPMRSLPGVGVAFQAARGLEARFGKPGLAEKHLDLLAMGIVADLASLTADTRYWLQRGLAALRQTQRPGLLAIFEMADVVRSRLSEEHISFLLAPRLNALGRLDDANPAVELLTSQDTARVRILAARLEALNAQRRLLCDQVTRAAEAQIDQSPDLLDGPALILAHPTWPAGVIGIVASRLVEQYHMPAILLACPPGEAARGSARSIEGFNITAAIAAVSVAQPGLIQGFGGHPMAAGLSLDAGRLPEFRRAFQRSAGELLGAEARPREIAVDARLPLEELSLDLVDDLERLAPFGPGNPALVMMTENLAVQSSMPVGRNREHLQVTVADAEGLTQKVIWWHAGMLGGGEDGALSDRPGENSPLMEGRIDLAYTVRSSDYRGQRQVQVEWISARPAEIPVIDLHDPLGAVQPPEPVEILDSRREPYPERLLHNLAQQPGVVIWAEGEDIPSDRSSVQEGGLNRYELLTRMKQAGQTAETLVIWTAPPGDGEIQAVLAGIKPRKVVLVARDPQLDAVQPFVRRLAGLVKHIQASGKGRVSLVRLAGAMAHRPETVLVGLEWLAARGFAAVRRVEGDELEVSGPVDAVPGSLPEIERRLIGLLEETAAYRHYFRNAIPQGLFEASRRFR